MLTFFTIIIILNSVHITVLPLSGGGVDDAEQLVIGHGLGVEVRPHRAPLHVLIGPLQ